MENLPITFHRTNCKWFIILFVEREEEAIREIKITQVITRRNKVKWLNETPVGDNTDTDSQHLSNSVCKKEVACCISNSS
jgi:hypothetical protein